MYFDFVQSNTSPEKLNGVSLELSQQQCADKTAYSIFEFLNPEQEIEFITETYKNLFYYPIYWFYTDKYLSSLEIPEFVLEAVNKKKAKILIVNIYEGYYILDEVEHYLLSKFSLSIENLVFLNGNRVKTDGVNSVYYNFWENIITNHDASPLHYFEKAYNLIFSKSNIRKNKFICLQRRPKKQRVALYTELFPFRNDGILTLGRGDRGTALYDNFYNTNLFGNLYKSSAKKFKKNNLISTLPAVYDTDVSLENPAFDNDSEKFYSSYLHIVSESFFENTYDMAFFSEKIYKPVIYFQPFVMFNQYNTLSEFRHLGYESFPDVIDESYDQISNDEKRFYSAVSSSIDFIKQNDKTLSKIMKKVFPVMSHNFYNLLSTVNTNQTRIKSELMISLYY